MNTETGRGGFLQSVPLVRRFRRKQLLSSVQSFDEVLVVPYQHLLTRQTGGHDHQGGPLWPDWERQSSARFNRDGQPQDVQPEPAAPEQTVSGDSYFWAGPAHPHFGHGIADFYSRLPCTLAQGDHVVLVFASRETHPIASLDDAPGWLRGLMAWYGIQADRVMFVTRPTLFKSLQVMPQQEQLEGIGPSDAYLDLLDEIVRRNLQDSPLAPMEGHDLTRPVYVSRAGMKTCFAGEYYLESLLEAGGINVFRPERHGLRRQMDVYCHARQLFFAEGSAIHGTQLLGRSLADVTVLVRRPGVRFGEPFLRPRARSLHYLDLTRGVIHGLNHRGRKLLSGGMPLLEEDKLLQWLDQLGLALPDLWDSAAYHEAQQRDVARWLEFTAAQPHSVASKDMICRTLQNEGFEELLSRARELKLSSTP